MLSFDILPKYNFVQMNPTDIQNFKVHITIKKIIKLFCVIYNIILVLFIVFDSINIFNIATYIINFE